MGFVLCLLYILRQYEFRQNRRLEFEALESQMKQIMEFRDQMMKKGEANSQDGTKLSLDEDAPIEEQVRQVFDQVIEAQKTQAKLQTQMDQPTSRAFVPAEELVGELAPVVGVVMNEELH